MEKVDTTAEIIKTKYIGKDVEQRKLSKSIKGK